MKRASASPKIPVAVVSSVHASANGVLTRATTAPTITPNPKVRRSCPAGRGTGFFFGSGGSLRPCGAAEAVGELAACDGCPLRTAFNISWTDGVSPVGFAAGAALGAAFPAGLAAGSPPPDADARALARMSAVDLGAPPDAAAGFWVSEAGADAGSSEAPDAADPPSAACARAAARTSVVDLGVSADAGPGAGGESPLAGGAASADGVPCPADPASLPES